LVAAPEVDIVTVAVKVPPHLEIVKAAIAAGKHVYCEWPLGKDLAEAEEMAALARARGVLGVVGTQARVAPEIEYLRQLIGDRFVGDVLSSTLVARGGALQGGGSIPDQKTWGYLFDRRNGATLLTIPVGHTLAALRDVFGDIAEVSAMLAVRRPTAIALDTGEKLPVTAPDQVLVCTRFASGMPISIHYRGGAARDGDGLFWEVHGTDGDIRLSGPSGHTQMCNSRSRARAAKKRSSSRWNCPHHTAPAGRRMRSRETSPGSMTGWHGTCGRAPALHRLLKTRSRCIASSRRSRRQPKPEAARLSREAKSGLF
jgi:predicted dehydrogenase